MPVLAGAVVPSTLSTLQQQVYDRLGSDSTDPMYPTATITRFVNDALHGIEAEHDWPWLQTSANVVTVAGTDMVSFPTNFMRVLEVRDDNGFPLNRYSTSEIDDRWRLTTQGKPQEFAVYAAQLLFRPVPDSAYTFLVRYIQAELDLGSSTDAPLIPATFAPIVADLATFYALRRDQEDPRAQLAWSSYQAGLKRMYQHARRYASPSRIRVRPGSPF